MRTTTSGRAFAKGIFDLFSTLMVSLPIENHKMLFKNYPNSFTAEEAIANLGGLQFIQSNRDADPKDPTRIITHVVTTQFSLSRDMAKNLCQTFMDARLFESASDANKREFQNKGIYQVTGKGAHILAKFVHRNALPVDETRHITANATAHLVYLDRAEDEDAIILSQKQIEIIFKRFAGPEPNVAKVGSPGSESPLNSSSPGSRDRTHSVPDLCNGIEVKDQQHNYDIYKHTFYGKAAVEWLMDYSTVISKEEAICIAQEMVTAGYLEQVGEDNSSGRGSLFKTGNSALYHLTEMGRAVAGWKSLVSSSGSSINNDWMEERGTSGGSKSQQNNLEIKNLSAQFRITAINSPRLPISVAREKRVAPVEDPSVNAANAFAEELSNNGRGSMRRLSQILNDPAFQLAALAEAGPGSVAGGMGMGAMSNYAPSSSGGRESIGGSGPSSSSSAMNSSSQVLTSNTTRLNIILANATLRDLFKNFLRQNICEENLSFYLEVLDYKAKFVTLINSTRAYTQQDGSQPPQQMIHPPALRELEKQICMQAFAIYETYLVSGAPKEVNLPHQMRQDITAYMQAVVRNMDTNPSAPNPQGPNSVPGSPSSEVGDSDRLGHPHHQKELIHISLFDGIHDHIFRLMSTDSVPKFTRTDKYREVMMNRVKQNSLNNGSNSASGASTPTATSPGPSRAGLGDGSVMMGGMVEAAGAMPTSPGTPGRIEDDGEGNLRRTLSFSDRSHQRAASSSSSQTQTSATLVQENATLNTSSLHSQQQQQPTRVPRARSASSNAPVNELNTRDQRSFQQQQQQQQQQQSRKTYNFEQPRSPLSATFSSSTPLLGVLKDDLGRSNSINNSNNKDANEADNMAGLIGMIVPRQQRYNDQRAQLPAKLQKSMKTQAQPPTLFPTRDSSIAMSSPSPKSQQTQLPLASPTKSVRGSNSVPSLSSAMNRGSGHVGEDESIEDEDGDDDLVPLHELLASSPPRAAQKALVGSSAAVPTRASTSSSSTSNSSLQKALPLPPLTPTTSSAPSARQVTVLFESTSVSIQDSKSSAAGAQSPSNSLSSLPSSPVPGGYPNAL